MNFVPASADPEAGAASATAADRSSSSARVLGSEVRAAYAAVLAMPSSAAGHVKKPSGAKKHKSARNTRSRRAVPFATAVRQAFEAADADDVAALDAALASVEAERYQELLRARDPHGWTLLHVAAARGSEAVAYQLMVRGADRHAGTARSAAERPVAVARRAGHAALADWLDSFLVDESQEGGGEDEAAAVTVDGQEEQPLQSQQIEDQSLQPQRIEEQPDSSSGGAALLAEHRPTPIEPVLDQALPAPWLCTECQETVTQAHHVHRSMVAHRLLQSQQAGDAAPPAGAGVVLTAANKGYRMLVHCGWDECEGLGRPGRQGRRQPVPTVLKRDRKGLGSEAIAGATRVKRPKDLWRAIDNAAAAAELTASLRQRPAARVSHFAPYDVRAVEDRKKLQLSHELSTIVAQRDAQRQHHIAQLQERRMRAEMEWGELPM